MDFKHYSLSAIKSLYILLKASIFKIKIIFLKSQQHKLDKNRTIAISCTQEIYNRYLLNLVLFFMNCGYNIAIESKISIISKIINGKYSKVLTQLPKVYFKNNVNRYPLIINDKNISLDYFIFNRENNNVEGYFIPMSQHPNIYLYKYGKNIQYEIQTNKELTNKPRINSLFFMGSTNEDIYDKFSTTDTFNIINRWEIIKRLIGLPNTFNPKNIEQLDSNLKHFDIIIIERDNFSIPQEQLHCYLSKFSFFLALPGVSMPFSHNIIEAMSVGCIPVIQKQYAKLFSPALENNLNCLTFESIEGLVKSSKEIHKKTNEEIATLRQNVILYFKKHLLPEPVVHSFLNHRNWFIIGEQSSINLNISKVKNRTKAS